MSNREQSIQRALNELEMSLFPPTHKVTEYPYAGRLSVAQTDRKSQRLSKEEEKVLIQYFGDLQRQNLCPISLEFDELSPKSCRIEGIIRRLESTMLCASYNAIQSSKQAKLRLWKSRDLPRLTRPSLCAFLRNSSVSEAIIKSKLKISMIWVRQASS
jgi:hypothetical protein